MPGCILRISGIDFAVDEFLASTSLDPYQVWHQGEARLRKGQPHGDSGFKVDVSQVDGDLPGQVSDAQTFLRRHQAELERLVKFPGATDRRLDFGYARRDVAVQCDYLPPELLALAGTLGIGIELSLYPPGNEEPATQTSVTNSAT